MGADPLVYCLERLSDYAQFERLCHDLASADGFRGLEPLGGTKDAGRDAVHVDAGTGTKSVFAYSVREDWRKKLEDDAAKVRRHGHPCERLLFFCTASFTAGERDSAIHFVRDTYGWQADLYGLERLATMLRSTHRHVVAQHPQIFSPPFFPVAGGLSLSWSPDHVLVDHVDADSALALWIARRLLLAGYSVWCRGLAPLAGSSVNDTVRGLLGSRAFAYVSVLSSAALADPDFNSRRAAAHSAVSGQARPIIVPAAAGAINLAMLDHETRRLSLAGFADGWAGGLKQVLSVLETQQCPRAPAGGRELTLRSYYPPQLVRAEAEQLPSNLFPVTQLPQAIRRFKSKQPLEDGKGAFAYKWAFKKAGDLEYLAFHEPPADMIRAFGIAAQGATLWARKRKVDGVSTEDLLTELIKKTMYVECLRRGLVFCEPSNMVYFPCAMLPKEHLRYRRLDGQATFFAVTGERAHGRSGGRFRYYVSPQFVPKGDPEGGYDLILRIRVRITDLDGKLYPGHGGNARRKKVCKSWWNDDWLSRLVGVMQFLGAENPNLTIGTGEVDRLVVGIKPRSWVSPVSLDESALTAGSSDDEQWRDEDEDDPEDENA